MLPVEDAVRIRTGERGESAIVEPSGRETSRDRETGMIVVAENDDGTRTVLASALARFGYDVGVGHRRPARTVDALESGQVGLLILDLRMPGMNGWEVLRRWKDTQNPGSPPRPARP